MKYRTVYALADYYNVGGFRPGHPRNRHSHVTAIERIQVAITNTLRSLSYLPAQVHLRLYGGWSDDELGTPTPDREQVGRLVGPLSRRRHPTLRILVEVADAFWSHPGYVIPLTRRRRSGFPKCELPYDHASCLSSNCAALQLRQWKQGRCPQHPACLVIADQVFATTTQKVVDTHLVTDAVSVCSARPAVLLVISNDDDMIPAVVAAAALGPQVVLLRIGRQRPSPYDTMLNSLRSVLLRDERPNAA